MEKLKCILKSEQNQQKKCQMTDKIQNILLGLQYAYVIINESLLIFAIMKMYKLIKGQVNSEARTTQFVFAISIAFVALISVPLSIFYYPDKDIDKNVNENIFFDWPYVEGILSITQFQFQFTILGFCWVYATKPIPPQTNKMENEQSEEEIKVELTQPDEFEEITERDFILEIDKKVDLDFANDENDESLDEDTKQKRRFLKKHMKKILYERQGIFYQSIKESVKEIEHKEKPLLIDA